MVDNFMEHVRDQAISDGASMATGGLPPHPLILAGKLILKDFIDPSSLNEGEDDMLLAVPDFIDKILLEYDLEWIAKALRVPREALLDPNVARVVRAHARAVAEKRGFRVRAWMKEPIGGAPLLPRPRPLKSLTPEGIRDFAHS